MSDSPEFSAPKIAVVDDDYELLKLITMLLRRIGAQSMTFLNGTEILQYLATETPDLIILDLMLPGMDGFTILQKIRTLPQLDQTPVLILSAKADPSTIRRGLECGADGYVTKPYIANSLIDRVRLLLKSGRQARTDGTLTE